MKQFFLLLSFTTILSFQLCYSQSHESKKLKIISQADSTLIIDVRTKEEYNLDLLDGSINIPLDVLTESVDVNTFKQYKNLILVCRSGGRSSKAIKILEDKGFTNLYNGGGWQDFEKMIKQK